MLPKPHRLPSVYIKSVMRAGKRTQVDFLQCVILSQKQTGPWRCAFVVSTAVDKRAVARNRIRRLLSESVRRLSPMPRAGLDTVYIVKKGFIYETQTQVDQMVQSVMQKSNTLLQI